MKAKELIEILKLARKPRLVMSILLSITHGWIVKII